MAFSFSSAHLVLTAEFTTGGNYPGDTAVNNAISDFSTFAGETNTLSDVTCTPDFNTTTKVVTVTFDWSSGSYTIYSFANALDAIEYHLAHTNAGTWLYSDKYLDLSYGGEDGGSE